MLLTNGYVQEANVIFRTLDEIQEDIFFLASAETNNAHTDRHTQYLEAFYSDPVFSRVGGSLDIPKPNLVPRKKIRAHTMNAMGQGINVSKALSASESVGTAYSGYVHAASENIMEMYGGDPPRFHINGMRGTTCALIALSTDVNYVNTEGNTALHEATLRIAEPPVLKALFEAGADLKCKDANGRSALHLTIINCNATALIGLLEAETDVPRIFGSYAAAVDFCEGRDAPECADIIRAHHAKVEALRAIQSIRDELEL